MPELPEITKLARQIKAHLPGKTVAAVEVLQPKCLNLPVEAFTAALVGAEILDASSRGKWIQVETTRGWLLLNLGMGGEILLTSRAALPEKYRLIIDFTAGSCLAINFWWFGYVHYAAPNALNQHEMVGKLGPNATDLSAAELGQLLAGRRGAIKAFLLDQSRIAGIGNSYIHDILYLARLHPLRKIESLSPEDIERLAGAIHTVLDGSLAKGGAAYEQDLFGQKGGFTFEDILIGYREGQPCPECGAPIQKLKTGSTSSFICPHCQPAAS
jgi:formamidopyrimidine-DNA glycosylase